MAEDSNLRAPLAVGLGAIAGAGSRYYIGQWLLQFFDISFPIDTLIVNSSGCLFLGIMTTLIARRILVRPDHILLMTTGFLGAYTTFSTYELETVQLLSAGMRSDAIVYWLGSLGLGGLCFSIGVLFAKKIVPSPNS